MIERYETVRSQVQEALRRGGPPLPPAPEGLAPRAVPRDASSRRLELDRMSKAISACQACGLGPARLERQRESYGRFRGGNTVPGEGPVGALLFAMGDRPGRAEEEQGRPIVGPTSAAFDQFLLYLGLDRSRDVFVANAVCCMPPLVREPTKAEWSRCTALWLHRQIRLVSPRIILVFGSVAFEALMQSPADKPDATPADCRSDYSSAKTFDERYGNRFVPYPHDPSILVWWARHYAALARDDRDRVLLAEQLLPLRVAIDVLKQRPSVRPVF